MWLQFAISCLFSTVVLYLPGFVFLRVMSKKSLFSICFAPVISLSVYSLIELFFLSFQIKCSAVSIGAATVAVIGMSAVGAKLLSCGVEQAKSEKGLDFSFWDLMFLCLFLLVGIVSVALYFVRPLDGPNSFFQGWDNTHHLAAIRTFVNSAEWNPLSSNRYLMTDVSPYLSNAASFYPSAWHVLCASVVSTMNVSIPMAINCVNAVLIGVVFPVSMFWLLRLLTESNKMALLFGSLITMGVPACPWDYVIYGPLFPNLMSTVLVPLGMAIFIQALQRVSQRSWKHCINSVLLLVAVVFSITLSHPNGVFTLLLLLSPYLVIWSARESKTLGANKVVRIIVPCVIVVAIVLFWTLCFNLPFLSDLVSVLWPSIKTVRQALSDVFFLSIVNHPEQPVIAFFLLLGIACSLYVPRHRWAVVSFILAALLYVVDAGTDLEIKSFLSGFWYTDYHRTGSLVGLMAIVLSVIGLSVISNGAQQRFSSRDMRIPHAVIVFMATALYCSTAVFIFSNRYAIKGANDEMSAFEYQATEFGCQYDFQLIYYDVMTYEEQLFSEKALGMMEEHALILGSPNDGSFLLYPLYNANMYYRNARRPSEKAETPESKIIRTRLCNYAFDSEVQEAVKQIGARYVLLLDAGEREDEFRINYVIYYPEDWVGIESISESTPGFTLLYQDKDMQLYEINRL